MKRNPDLIRAIALQTEALPFGQVLTDMEEASPEEFFAHVVWMREAGLIDALVVSYKEGAGKTEIARLTWEGCDFLDAARSDTLWQKAKSTILAPGVAWTFEILKDWLKTEVKNGFSALR